MGAFHLAGLAELKKLPVLAGVNGKRKSTPREDARASCAVSCVFILKGLEIFCPFVCNIGHSKLLRISRVVRAVV